MPKRTLEKLSMPTKTAVTVGAGAVFALALCSLFAFAATLSDDPTANLTLYGEICFCLTMLFCGILGAKLAADKKFVCGFAAGGIMLLIATAAMLFLGTDSAIKTLIIALVGLFFAAAGSALGAREVKRKRRR